jgi:hypothetical protein
VVLNLLIGPLPVENHRVLFLDHFCFTFANFICMLMIYKSIPALAFLIYRCVMMRLDLDLQRTFDWAGLMDGNSIQKESGHTY